MVYLQLLHCIQSLQARSDVYLFFSEAQVLHYINDTLPPRPSFGTDSGQTYTGALQRGQAIALCIGAMPSTSIKSLTFISGDVKAASY